MGRVGFTVGLRAQLLTLVIFGYTLRALCSCYSSGDSSKAWQKLQVINCNTTSPVCALFVIRTQPTVTTVFLIIVGHNVTYLFTNYGCCHHLAGYYRQFLTAPVHSIIVHRERLKRPATKTAIFQNTRCFITKFSINQSLIAQECSKDKQLIQQILSEPDTAARLEICPQK